MLFIAIIILFLILLKIKLFTNDNIVYYISIILICVFAISIRMHLANNKTTMFWDEKYSILSSNNSINKYYGYYTNLNNTLGEEIFKNNYYDDTSIRDVINDIKSLYIDSKDPFISNLYYSLLRIAFTGQIAYKIKEIVFVASILNSIFFVISYIFLFKLLKLIFDNKNKNIILVSLFIMAINPVSISFSIFVRPYQIQETFLIAILYIVLNTIIYNRYSIKNFILTILISGLGYLTLSSTLIFILILSFMLFFCKINIKTLIYYALIFNIALVVSQLLYTKFFNIIFSQTGRSGIHLFPLTKLFYYINFYTFCGSLPYIIIALFITIIIYGKKKYTYDNNKINILIFIILFGIISSVISYIVAGHDAMRYSANGYIFILFIIPLFLFLIKINSIKMFISIILAANVLANSTDRIDFSNYTKYSHLQDNINVYFYSTQMGFKDWYNIDEINTNLYYSYIDNLNDLITQISNKNESSFYLLVNKDNDILNNSFFNDYEKIDHNVNLINDDEGRILYKLIKN